MPIMEVLVSTTYFGQRFLNRWNYIASGTPAAVTHSFGLASAFGLVFATVPPVGSVFEAMRDLQSSVLSYDFFETRDLYSVTDFFNSAFPSGLDGTAAGDGLAPTAAYGFRTSRVRADIRRGMKRIGGGVETAVQSGGFITSAAMVFLDDMADKMSAVLTYDDSGNTLSYTPAILGTEEYTTPSGKTAYRHYLTEAEQLNFIAQGFAWEPYPELRTQNTRQYGRGV